MGKISSYPQASPVTTFRVLGTDTANTTEAPSGTTETVTLEALLGWPLGANVIFVNTLSGVDPTGVSDSTAAIAAAQTAAGTSPYVLVFGIGTYLIGTSGNLVAFGPNQGLVGSGSALTEINYVGSATCLAVYESSFSSGSVGGPFRGFSLSGYSATGSAKGFSWGNLQAARCSDITISGFPGDGLYLHNGNATTEWSEQAEWVGIKLVQNATGVVFDTGSFDYSIFQFLIVANSGQNGVTLQNAATLAGERFELRGNFTAGAGNSAWVIGVDPAGGGSGTSSMTAAAIYVNVECDGSTGTGHTTIAMDGSSSTQLTGNGTLNFLPGTVAFTGMTPIASLNGIFGFSGTINEPTLGSMVTGDAHAFTGGTNWSEIGSLSTAAYNGMDIYPQFGDYQGFLLPNGAITVAAFSGSPYNFARHLTIFFKQPATGSPGTITWTPTITWIGGSSLSATNGVVDRADLYWLPSESKWFGTITLSAGAAIGGGTLTTYIAPKVFTLTDGASVAVNAALGNVARWPLAGSSHTLAAPSNPVDGMTLKIRIVYSGAYTPLWNAIWDFTPIGGAPAWTSVSGKVDDVGFEYNADAGGGSGAWVCVGWVLGA